MEASKLKHKSSKFNRYSLRKILHRREIGKRMKEVVRKLDEVAAERSKFHLREMVVERQSKAARNRETGSILNEPGRVYGRDEEKEKIVDILVNRVRDSRKLSILPILGIGGLGKTTLAQLVYNHPQVSEHFEKKLWVCVSDNFDIKTLVRAMIESASGCGSESNLVHLDVLQRCLLELLNQKRYLLILDDVWSYDQESWDTLKDILACGSSGASVVVTTRLKRSADIMATLPAHCLSGLSEEHCWLLFKSCAFGQEADGCPNLEAIGKEIVKKCGGGPLAAKALGGLLRFKRKENEWVYVKESEIWNLPQEEALILPVLRLSYQHLPLQLRQCFAYCAVFPKDTVIEKEELIYCWMAHGYISSNGRMDAEDVGNEVWNELALRSLFQDANTHQTYFAEGGNCYSKTYFKMHDFVHDLAQSIMENKIPGANIESSALNSIKIRQANLHEHVVAFPTSIHLDMDMSYILRNFSRLRVLDVSRTDMEDMPSAVGNLKCLRYLNLSDSKFLTLPNKICTLWNLQILNLSGCLELVSLPKHMRDMKNLRHLLLDGCFSLSEMPPKLGELTSLKTLSVFIVGQESGNQLDELQYLNIGGELEITHLERVKSDIDGKKANIGEKSNLRGLVLRWTVSEQQEMNEKVLEVLEPHQNLEILRINGFKGRYFPPWMRMKNVVEIHIRDCPNCLHVSPLGDLPHLELLDLTNLAALKYVVESGFQGGDQVKAKFPSLREVTLSSLPSLKGLLKEEGGEVFLKLQKLSISCCPSLILPPLSSLKNLWAKNCTSLNLNSLSKLANLIYLSVKFDNDMTTFIPKETLENLSNLESLDISNLNQNSLPINGFQGLKSLKKLCIHHCDTLTCLPNAWLRHLTTLEILRIFSCKELVDLPEEIKYLHSLKRLELGNLPKMVCLPEVLQHLVPSLHSLHLNSLEQLTALPDWLGNFASLEILIFNNCPGLTSLPASIQGMKNLRRLSIWGNVHPQLKRRSEKEKGEDWHIIAHILDISIAGVRY